MLSLVVIVFPLKGATTVPDVGVRIVLAWAVSFQAFWSGWQPRQVALPTYAEVASDEAESFILILVVFGFTVTLNLSLGRYVSSEEGVALTIYSPAVNLVILNFPFCRQ